MNINIKDILTLDDDNDYMVISKAKYNNKNYYYLMDNNNSTNILFCYEDKDELVEIKDKDLTTKLLPLFFKEIQVELDKQTN